MRAPSGSAVSASTAGKSPPNQSPSATWPNPAESRTNYHHLLTNLGSIRIRDATQKRIAIVGAGIAGLTLARELIRLGVGRVHVFEASDRIGGRLWTERTSNTLTPYELGAMRMPFFDANATHNCALAYYERLFNLVVQPFPNPGSSACNSGIWVNQGFGPDRRNPYRKPQLDVWKTFKDDSVPPPHKLYTEIRQNWLEFAVQFKAAAQIEYARPHADWWKFWHDVARQYQHMNFRDLVHAPKKTRQDPPGYFGGLGMTEGQAELFYVIGMGDGGWGAFYDISALWVMRTALFGYATSLQSVLGKLEGDSYRAATSIIPTSGRELIVGFRGIQSLPECMLTEPIGDDGNEKSLKEHMNTRFELHTGTRVTDLERKDGTTRLGLSGARSGTSWEDYHAVIVTTSTWSGQFIKVRDDASARIIRTFAQPAMTRSHSIVSSKVFFELKKRFWNNSDPTAIPQVICTDTFVQGMYGYSFHSDDPGVLLASYTWEDDSVKLLGVDDRELGRMCLEHLDEIVAAGIVVDEKRTNLRRISEYVLDPGKPRVFHWAEQPSYAGCAKLYRQRSWHDDYELLTFNRRHSKDIGLYFAGEAYSVEGGWTEPALRSAVDTICQIAIDSGDADAVPSWYADSLPPIWCTSTSTECRINHP